MQHHQETYSNQIFSLLNLSGEVPHPPGMQTIDCGRHSGIQCHRDTGAGMRNALQEILPD